MFARHRRHRRRRQLAPAGHNETLGFHNFYARFSSVSPTSIGMGLRSPTLQAGEAQLKVSLHYDVNTWLNLNNNNQQHTLTSLPTKNLLILQNVTKDND